jgi:tyrosine-protein phosphatase SIW14
MIAAIISNRCTGGCLLAFENLVVRTAAVALFAISVHANPAAAQMRSDVPAALDLSAIRIDNFGQVSSTFYRGAQPTASDYANLKALGVKTIIDLTSDDGDPAEQSLTQKAGMTYVHIPMTTHEAPTSAQLGRFLELVNDPQSQPVYVHCVGGRHRTGVMTAAYRISHDGWNADRAFSEMKQYKFGADFLHSEFKTFVYNYRAPAATAAATAATK